MGSKYREYTGRRGPTREEMNRIHPIWRGVGFAFMILIPVISYAATDVLIKQNGVHNWFPLPVDLIAKQGQFLYRIFPDPMVNIKVLFIIVFMFILFSIFTLLSFIITSAFGYTPRKDPFYVPPVQRRRRRR